MKILVGQKESTSNASIEKPYGITFFAGRLYVCDTMLPGVDVLDLRLRTFERRIPERAGKLKKPINCHVDRGTGQLYVADTERGQVVVFDSAGKYLTAFGERGARPADVFVDKGGIWVADLASRSIHLYERDTYRPLASFPDTVGEGRLILPANVWVEGGEVYVSDANAFTVKVFDRQGRYLRSVGQLGTGFGQFGRPKGLAVDRAGILYAVDAASETVQLFDREGRLLMYFGGPTRAPGGLWLPAKVTISYDDLDLFRPYVDPRFEAEYLIFVTNQYGPDKVNVYAFLRPRAR